MVQAIQIYLYVCMYWPWGSRQWPSDFGLDYVTDVDVECCVKLADEKLESVAKQQQDMLNYCSQKNGNANCRHFICLNHQKCLKISK